MSNDQSWWITAEREQFTAEAQKHRPQMETSTGAKVLQQIQSEGASEGQRIKERRGGKWSGSGE